MEFEFTKSFYKKEKLKSLHSVNKLEVLEVILKEVKNRRNDQVTSFTLPAIHADYVMRCLRIADLGDIQIYGTQSGYSSNDPDFFNLVIFADKKNRYQRHVNKYMAYGILKFYLDLNFNANVMVGQRADKLIFEPFLGDVDKITRFLARFLNKAGFRDYVLDKSELGPYFFGRGGVFFGNEVLREPYVSKGIGINDLKNSRKKKRDILTGVREVIELWVDFN